MNSVFQLEQYFSLTLNQPAVIIYDPANSAEWAEKCGAEPEHGTR